MPYRLALDLRSEPMTQSGRYWKPHSPLATLLYQQVRHAVKLRRGERASFPSSGNSLWPKVCSGDRCVYEPVFDDKDVSEGDIVFRHINKRSYFRYFAHRVLDNIIWEGDSSGTLEVTATAIAESIPFASRLHRGCIEAASATTDRGCIEAASATTEAASTSGSMGKHWHGSWATAVDRAGSAQDPHHPGGRASLRGVPESRFR